MEKINEGKIVKARKFPKANILLDVFAFLFWTYLTINLFVININLYIVRNYFPDYIWIYNYKVFFTIAFILFIGIILRYKRSRTALLYIAFFPFLYLFIFIPVSIFLRGSWILAIAIVHSVISFFSTLKYHFIALSLFVISLVLTITTSLELLMVVSIFTSSCFLILVYYKNFVSSLKASKEYSVYKKALKFFKDKNLFKTKNEINFDSSQLEAVDQKQLANITTNLQLSVIYNRLLIFIAKKMKAFNKSSFNLISSCLSILKTLSLTILTFALINFSLFKINPINFKLTSTPNFFMFVYYSFNAIINNTISEIVPNSTVTRTVIMAEYVFAFFLIIIGISILYTAISAKRTNEFDEIINDLESQGNEIEDFIKCEYHVVNIDEAIKILEKLKSSFISFIYFFTKHINN